MEKQALTTENKSTEIMTLGQKVDLFCDIFFFSSISFPLLGFILWIAAAAVGENTLSVILIAICILIAIIFTCLWLWIEFHKEELKTPKWLKEAEQAWEQEVEFRMKG